MSFKQLVIGGAILFALTACTEKIEYLPAPLYIPDVKDYVYKKIEVEVEEVFHEGD